MENSPAALARKYATEGGKRFGSQPGKEDEMPPKKEVESRGRQKPQKGRSKL